MDSIQVHKPPYQAKFWVCLIELLVSMGIGRVPTLRCFNPARRQLYQRQTKPLQPILLSRWMLRLSALVVFVLLWILHGQSRILLLHRNSSLSASDFTNSGSPEFHAINLRHSSNDQNNPQKLQLRLDWTNLEPMSDLTRQMVAHQKNCSAPMGTFVYRNRFGLGSDLHVWGQALCNGMQSGWRLRTVGNWTWMDQTSCGQEGSPMLCYFESSELNCPEDLKEAIQNKELDPTRALGRSNGIVQDQCQSIYQGMDRLQVRRSAMEFLFLRLTPRVVQEAQRQLNMVFQGLDQVPSSLITVHIRWGDKEREMKLVEIHAYIRAVQRILDRRQEEFGIQSQSEAPHIYLATEDPEAVQQFRNQMPSGWNLYVDQAFVDLLPYRVQEYNGSPKMSKAVHGRAGLITLGSLLVAMEANDFVLTTASNWSRVMNELRQTILDPRCGNCTGMIDLRKVRNEW